MEAPMAVIKTGGKQYLVESGSELEIEKLGQEIGSGVTFDQVLLFVDSKGQVKIGRPFLENVKVQGELVDQAKGPKLQGIRYYEKRHMRKYGHRQRLSKVKIVSVGARSTKILNSEEEKIEDGRKMDK